MSDDNVAIVRRFEEIFVTDDFMTAITETCDPGLVDHNPLPGHEPNLEGFTQAVTLYHDAFDLSGVDLHAVIGQDDVVATNWTVSGTHKGEFFGIAPTGKTILVGGMNFYRLANGKITEVWTQFDALSMFEQLGEMPK